MSVEAMERQYHCKYVAGGGSMFPVTHVLHKGDREKGKTPMRYAHIGISNGEHLNWTLYDERGTVVVQGSERNHSRTRLGYIHMIKGALRLVRYYGAQRVYPSNSTHRKEPARSPARWMPHAWPR
jgi:hypothetical protein